MQISTQPAAVAYLLRTNDRRLQAYCQGHPFLTGPDESLNAEGLALLRAGPQIRRPSVPADIILLEPLDYATPSEVFLRVREMAAAIGLGADEVPPLIDDFYWKVAAAGIAPADILCFGCGRGEELIVLRAVYPQARIVAVDWEDRLRPSLSAATRVEFRQTDLLDNLETLGHYDLIFSNHTLEHFYDPDAMLAGLAGCVRDGGALVSGLPLDGEENDFFSTQSREWARRPTAAHWFDVGWMDPGHPWKTNASDVADTLHRAGFSDVKLYQRTEHLTRELAVRETTLRRYRQLRGLENSIWRTLCRGAASIVDLFTSGRPPAVFRKIMLALDMRVPWGANRLKNAQAKELAFVAKR